MSSRATFQTVSVEIARSKKALARRLRKDGIRGFSIKRAKPHPVFDKTLSKGQKRYVVSYPLESPATKHILSG